MIDSLPYKEGSNEQNTSYLIPKMGFSLELTSSLVLAAAFIAAVAATGADHDTFQVKPFKIDLTAEIPRLKSLVANSRLPTKALYPDGGSGERGIELDVLQELRTDWLSKFDWEAEQAELNTSVLAHFPLTLM